eukprot:1148106-Pelagomonas_calceolata.AAC.1
MSILWLLNTVRHAILASTELYMNVAWGNQQAEPLWPDSLAERQRHRNINFGVKAPYVTMLSWWGPASLALAALLPERPLGHSKPTV